MSSFENRIKLQKLIYILQSEGIDFGYEFTWYIRGPYSSLLADDGYAFSKNKDEIDMEYQPTTAERDILRRISRATGIIQDSNNAELVASYLYLQRRYPDNTSEELRTRKRRFTIPQIETTMARWNELT